MRCPESCPEAAGRVPSAAFSRRSCFRGLGVGVALAGAAEQVVQRRPGSASGGGRMLPICQNRFGLASVSGKEFDQRLVYRRREHRAQRQLAQRLYERGMDAPFEPLRQPAVMARRNRLPRESRRPSALRVPASSELLQRRRQDSVLALGVAPGVLPPAAIPAGAFLLLWTAAARGRSPSRLHP